MARRSGSVALLAGVLVAAMLPLSASAVDPLPSSVAAVGDSISQAVSSGGSLGASYPANSWSTGTNTTVNSHYARLLALNPAISGHAWNDAVSGAKMADLDGQMRSVVGQQPDYLTVLIGGNDLCTDTVAQMTSVADFGAQFTAAMNTLTAGSPTTKVYVVSIPRVYQLWELFKGSFWARSVWSLGGICQSLLANPTSTQAADVAAAGPGRPAQRRLQREARRGLRPVRPVPVRRQCRLQRRVREVGRRGRLLPPVRRGAGEARGRHLGRRLLAQRRTGTRRPTDGVVHGVLREPGLHVRRVGLHRRPRHRVVRLDVRRRRDRHRASRRPMHSRSPAPTRSP